MFFYNSIFTFIFPMVFCSSRIRHSSRYAFSLYSSKAEFSERSRAISFSCSSALSSAFAFSSPALAINSGAGSCLAVCSRTAWRSWRTASVPSLLVCMVVFISFSSPMIFLGSNRERYFAGQTRYARNTPAQGKRSLSAVFR